MVARNLGWLNLDYNRLFHFAVIKSIARPGQAPLENALNGRRLTSKAVRQRRRQTGTRRGPPRREAAMSGGKTHPVMEIPNVPGDPAARS